MNGGTCKDLLSSFQCICRPGFTGERCERNCPNKADIAFLIDSSGSITRERFGNITKFVKQIVRQTDRSDNIKVGLIYFSDTAVVQLGLTHTTQVEDIMFQANKLPFIGGKTNIASAIRLMRRELFQARNGDRLNVPNHCILITDSIPNVETLNTVPEAVSARIEGTHIILVTVGFGLTGGRLLKTFYFNLLLIKPFFFQKLSYFTCIS